MTIKFFAGTVACFALSACGGGGSATGGGTPVPAPVPSPITIFPVEPVFVSLASSTSAFKVTALDASGSNYELSLSLAPQVDKIATFLAPTLLKVYSTSSIIKKNGVTASTQVTENFYSLSPFAIWGSVSGTDMTQATQKTPLPASASIGTSGGIFSGQIAFDNNRFNVRPRVATWSLEQDTSTTAWLCVNTTTKLAFLDEIESDCFKVDATGKVIGFKADFSSGTTTLRFR